MPDLRVYGAASGQSSVFYFPFLNPSSSTGAYRSATPAIASGDAKIMKDGGAWASSTNLPVWEGEGYGSITLSSTEMQGEIIVVKIQDQTATEEWVDTSIIIHTGGHASALHSG